MEALHAEVDRTVRVQSGLQDFVEILFAAQRTTEKRIADTVQAVALLAESQKHSDDRLDALIQVVDGLIPRPPPHGSLALE